MSTDHKSPPSIPLKLRILYVVLNLILRLSKRRDGTLNRAILAFFEARVPPDPTRGADGGVATYDHVVDPARGLSVRYFSPGRPEGERPAVVVVYFHGGGFVTGSARSPQFDSFCRRLSGSLPAHVVSVDYRLAPEHRYPAPCDDGIDVLRWLDSGDSLGIEDLSAVVIAGDSAGGNIAHHVARRATGETYDRIKIVGLAAIQPFLGGEDDTESERRLPFVSRENLKWIWRSFLPEGSDCDHEVANVFGPGSTTTTTTTTGSSCGDWSRFPPTMVVVGGLDSLQDRQRWYYEGLRRMGVKVRLDEFPNGVHSFPVFLELPESRQLIQDFRDFVQSVAQ